MSTYVIESRDSNGNLKLDCDQPESVFGMRAIKGLSENEMADEIFRRVPNATLRGDSIANWPALINPNWKARVKYW